MPIDSTNLPSQPTGSVEIRIRLVSAMLIIAVVGLAVLAYRDSVNHLIISDAVAGLLNVRETREPILAQLQAFNSTSAGLFGSLTTFLGTALGAYFGISAASSSVRTLSTAVQSSTDQIKQISGSNATLQADNTTLRNTSDTQQKTIDAAHKSLGELTNTTTPVDLNQIKNIQTVLKPL